MNKTDRESSIIELKKHAPKITVTTMSSDMGCEFEAIVSGGIIFAVPGMLLSVSGGRPLSDAELLELIEDGSFEVTPWNIVDDESLFMMLNDLND